MRVLLVANFEADEQKSMLLYADWVKTMAENHGHDVRVARPTPFFVRLSRHPGFRKYLGYLDKFIVFPRRLAKLAKQYDIVHVLDHSNSMYLQLVKGKPKFITCHDLLAIRGARGEFPKVTTSLTGRLLQRWILSGLRKADFAICVSEKTARDLQRFTTHDRPQMRVIHHSLNSHYGPGAKLGAALESKLALNAGQPYLIHVGGNSWYKNRLGALHIFAHFAEMLENTDHKFVMVGPRWTSEMVSFVRENGLSARVVEAVGIGASELRELYCNAAALLFPSFEEGFGWPVLEAQACGCLVITTGRPPMTEVAGEAAIYIDPNEPERAAQAMSAGIRNGDSLRAAGFRNLERFNEKKVAAQYMEFYEAVAAPCSSSSSSPLAEFH